MNNSKNYNCQKNLLWLLVFANCPTYNKTHAPKNN